MSEAGRRFREILAAPGITVLPGVFNGFSARLVQDMGYQAAAISGAGVSESLLGWADRGILTFDQNLNVCRLLAECVDSVCTSSCAPSRRRGWRRSRSRIRCGPNVAVT